MTGDVQPCPLAQRFALEVQLFDDLDAPVPGELVELRDGGPTRCLRAYTDVDGWVRFDGLRDQDYTLTLPALDESAWSLLRTEAMHDPRGASDGNAAWAPAPDAPEAPPAQHVAVQGDCVASIGKRYGFAPDAFWTDAFNALLRRQRSSGYVLLPGDVVRLKPRTARIVAAHIGSLHVLRRHGVPERLRVRFLDEEHKPRAGLSYLAVVTSGDGLALPSIDGKLDGDGMLDQPIPPDATRAEIRLAAPAGTELHVLQLGCLDPNDTDEGARARLHNLGYLPQLENDDPDLLGAAIARFQAGLSLPVTGELDDATRKKLKDLHIA